MTDSLPSAELLADLALSLGWLWASSGIGCMCITVILVGILRDYGMSSGRVELPGARATVDELLGQLSLPPDLVAISLVNGLQRCRGHRLVEGDVVKLVPIMGGG